MLFLRAELGVLGCYKNFYMFEYVIHLLINMTELLASILECPN